jgi:hypothetical protein
MGLFLVGGGRRGTVRRGNCPKPGPQTTVTRWAAPIAALLLLAPWLLVSWPAAAGWRDAQPPDGRLDYNIIREGSPVGQQSVEFMNNGDGFIVRTEVEIEVGFLSITLYRFKHDAVETWSGGRLVGFVSKTNDDGKDRAVDLQAEGDRLKGVYNDNPVDFPGEIIPASLWHPGTLTASVLLDPIRGRNRNVAVEDRGMERITVAGREIETHHYSITGQMVRELWYDADGRLVQVHFPAKDGSEIQVKLK